MVVGVLFFFSFYFPVVSRGRQAGVVLIDEVHVGDHEGTDTESCADRSCRIPSGD